MDVVLNKTGTCGACKHWGKTGTDWCSKLQIVQFFYVDASDCEHYKDTGRKEIIMSMAGVASAEFESPEAKDEFIRGLATTAQSGGSVRDFVLNGADEKKVN